ncbi:MAG TPA: hypothetical protein VK509_17000, partial [Polyangiales bacterium]|nr:hypothetical protein [Polyangiales bacterium]
MSTLPCDKSRVATQTSKQAVVSLADPMESKYLAPLRPPLAVHALGHVEHHAHGSPPHLIGDVLIPSLHLVRQPI